MDQPEVTNKRRERIRQILQPLWDTYQHMYNSRRNNVSNRINFLLVVVSFLPVISITFFNHYKNESFLVPATLQILALLILMKSFFVKSERIPWIDPDKILVTLDRNKFEEDFFAQLKAAEGYTHTYMSTMEKIMKYPRYLLIFSIYATFVIFPFIYLNDYNLIYIAVLLITIIFLILFNYYLEPIEYDESYSREFERIEKWLKGDE